LVCKQEGQFVLKDAGEKQEKVRDGYVLNV
jgi:hypothetical protein